MPCFGPMMSNERYTYTDHFNKFIMLMLIVIIIIMIVVMISVVFAVIIVGS